jgi:hypothetical protein
MSELTQIEQDIAEGQAEAATANELRKRLRWRAKPGSAKRERDIERRLRAIDAAMKPLRAHIGRLAWEPLPDATDNALRETSHALQSERKQLKKMRRPS